MDIRNWFRRGKKGKQEEPPVDTNPFADLNDDELMARALLLDWRPTRTVPGVAYSPLGSDDKLLLNQMERRRLIQFVNHSGSLDSDAYYAVKEPFKAMAEGKPGYAEAKTAFDAITAEKLKQEIKKVAALSGWESDHNGGFELPVHDRSAGKDLVSQKDLELLGELKIGGFVEYRSESKKDQNLIAFFTRNPELCSEIDKVQNPNQNHTKREDNAPEAGELNK